MLDSLSYQVVEMYGNLCFTLLVCTFGLLSAKKVEFKPCTSPDGATIEVDVTPCPEEPCQLKRGTTVELDVNFTPNADITKLTSVVHGEIGPIPVPFPVPVADACKGQGLTCPLKKGKTYRFTTKLPIKSEYPKLEVKVKWEAKDQDGKDVFCWEIAAEIV